MNARRSPGTGISSTVAPSPWLLRLLPLGLALAAFTAYWPALSARFVNFDDDRLFLANVSRYREPLLQQLHWMFTYIGVGDYQPLTWLSASLDYRLSGTDPFSYHFNSLLLHALSAVVLYFVAVRLLRAAFRLGPADDSAALRLAAAAGAALWAVHPLRVESVAWASERRDTLSVFLLLLSLVAYLRACPPGETRLRSERWYWGSVGLLLLSLLAKAWGMTFFVCLAILDVYPLRRVPDDVRTWWTEEARAVWLQKVPFAVLGIAGGAVAWYAQAMTPAALMPLSRWNLRDRVVQAFYGLAFYVRKTVWPDRLAALYERPLRVDWSRPEYVLSIIAVLAGVALAIRLRRRIPGLAAAGAVYVVLVAPVLGLAQSGPQMVADRYSYPSCIPWMVLVAGGLFAAWRRRAGGWRRTTAVLFAAGFVALFAATWRQTEVWHDSRSLWSHAIDVGASSSIAHLNYGQILREDGRNTPAIAQYRAAVAVRPDYGNAWYNLGNALTEAGDKASAEQAYRQAIQYMTSKQYAWLNLGNLYLTEGRWTEALAAYRQSVAFVEGHASPAQSPEPYLALGSALLQAGQPAAARGPLLVASRYPRTRATAEALLRQLP